MGSKNIWIIVTDLHGLTRLKIIPRPIERVVKEKIYINGLFTFDLIDEPIPELQNGDPHSNVSIKLDTNSIRNNPWQEGSSIIFGSMVCDNQPSLICPRRLLQDTMEEYSQNNLVVTCGMEMEWTLLANSFSLEQALYPMHSHSSRPWGNSKIRSLIENITHSCKLTKIQIDSIHTEFGDSMFEMALGTNHPLDMADNVQLFRMITKYESDNLGYKSTFAPKCFLDKAGSGCHVHLSLQNLRGKNLRDKLLNEFLAGILYYMKDCSPILLPNSMSYARLTGDLSTTQNICYDFTRSGSIRIVEFDDPTQTRLEVRTAGGDVNPYLLLNFILRAGLEGIQNSFELNWKPLQVVDCLPKNLKDACELFMSPTSKSRKLFTSTFIQHFGQQRLYEATSKRSDKLYTELY